MLNDYGKLLVLLTAIGAAVALALAESVSGEAAIGIILVVVGYVTGNGVLAARKKAPSPVIVPAGIDRQDLEDTLHRLLTGVENRTDADDEQLGGG